MMMMTRRKKRRRRRRRKRRKRRRRRKRDNDHNNDDDDNDDNDDGDKMMMKITIMTMKIRMRMIKAVQWLCTFHQFESEQLLHAGYYQCICSSHSQALISMSIL